MKAFIFDFDGVIVDSEIHWDALAFDLYRSVIPTLDPAYEQNLKGRNAHDIYNMLAQDYGLAMSREEFMIMLQTLTDKIYGELTKLMPGLVDLVRRLHQRGIPTGVASSSERHWLEWAAKRLGVDHLFDPVIVAADVGIGKPDPAVYLECAKRMGFAPNECVAIEDSKNGLISAKAAGMACIGLHHVEGYVQDLTGADIEINSLNEITDEVLSRFGF